MNQRLFLFIIAAFLLQNVEAHSNYYNTYDPTICIFIFKLDYIIWFGIILFASIIFLVVYCEKRKKNNAIKAEMLRKQMQFANVQGLSIQELLQGAGNPNTMHI